MRRKGCLIIAIVVVRVMCSVLEINISCLAGVCSWESKLGKEGTSLKWPKSLRVDLGDFCTCIRIRGQRETSWS